MGLCFKIPKKKKTQKEKNAKNMPMFKYDLVFQTFENKVQKFQP